MGRLQRLLKRFAKPAAMVAVAGTLSLSLIVTTPSNAYAFKQKFPVTPTFVMGAVKTVAPVAMAAVSVTPIGWGLRIYQLGMLAFSTSDMWMPYVTGAFGNPTAESEADRVQYRVLAGWRLTGQTVGGTDNLDVTMGYSWIGGSSKTVTITQQGTCEQFATGNASRPVGTQFANNTYWTLSMTSTPVASSLSGKVCPAGSRMIGLYSGPSAAGSNIANGPENMFRWGTTAASTGFDPRSNDIGYVGKSECIDAAGTKSWVSGPEVPGDNGAMLMPSCEKAGKGHGTGRTTVTAFKPDGTQETVWDTGAQPLMDPATPLCDPGRATSGCVMEVLKDDKPCSPGDVECENWQEESGKDPTRWKCKFGPYTLPLSACNLLARAYSPNGAPVNDENTDGNPQTNSNAGPDGSPVTAPAPSVAGTTTGTAPVPGGAGQAGPGADSQSKQCYPTGWAAANPIEWVMKPVGCALDAAFKPTKDLQTRLNSMQGQFANKVPMSWFGLGTAGVSGGGCPTDWALDVSGQHVSLICGTPAEGIIQTFRPVLGAMLIIAAIWPLLRSLFYAAIPVFRVTPS